MKGSLTLLKETQTVPLISTRPEGWSMTVLKGAGKWMSPATFDTSRRGSERPGEGRGGWAGVTLRAEEDADE